jgi:3-oxoacyl-[acyl-carrier protein] reductase
MKFKDRVVLVTGAARGIGWGIAHRFVKEGAHVVLNDIEGNLIKERTEELKNQGLNTYGIHADVSKGDEVDGMVNEVLDLFGRLDVLVNNAAVFNSKPILDIDEHEWDRVLAVNLKGVFNCSRAAARHMIKERRGRIVNIASLTGKTGRVIFSDPGTPTWACYTTTKAGIIALTKSMAYEWAPYNVFVNAVAPGPIRTEKISDEQAESIARRVPLGKMGNPDDVARAVMFLASDELSFITGEILDVNGGALMD